MMHGACRCSSRECAKTHMHVVGSSSFMSGNGMGNAAITERLAKAYLPFNHGGHRGHENKKNTSVSNRRLLIFSLRLFEKAF